MSIKSFLRRRLHDVLFWAILAVFVIMIGYSFYLITMMEVVL